MPVSPSLAATAYEVARTRGVDAAPGAAAEAGKAEFSFGEVLKDALGQAVETGRTSEAKAMEAVAGGGDLVDVVTAVAAAEVTLQTVVTVRDRVVSAYQEIMRMPI